MIIVVTVKDDFAAFNVMQCKTVLDPGFYPVDSRFQVLDHGFLFSGTGIPDFNSK